MARCHVRCKKCEARRVLAKTPEEYFRYSPKQGAFISSAPACRECSGRDYRVDNWMNNRNTRAVSCQCAGYVVMTRREPWPHRIGSPYCCYRKDGTPRMPGDVDFKDFQLEQQGATNEQQIV